MQKLLGLGMCIGCGYCVDLCPYRAIVPTGGTIWFNYNLCAGCAYCQPESVCPVGAFYEGEPDPRFQDRLFY